MPTIARLSSPVPSVFRAGRALRILLPLVLAARTSATPAPQTHVEIDPQLYTAPYEEVDNVGGAWVQLATFPVRPMLYDPQGKLWVVNHHDSTIERFSGVNPNPDRIYGVPWSPASIAYWNGDATHAAELLVVCRGTWAVVGLDPATGTPTRLLQLRPGAGLPGGLDARIGRMAEPGDILVDDTNERAFVSCTGADSVVQIDLSANKIVRVFSEQVDASFRLKSPLHLAWDHNGVDVLCAPLHSGHNSLASGGLITSTLVQDFAGLSAPDQGLPDEDLFRIRPWVDANNPGSVEVLLKEVGTILFAHGIHPATNDFWQLNTEADNKDPSKQTEPLVKGIFSRNRVSIVQNNGATWGTSVGPILGLDPGDFGGLITSANTVGQPVALAFNGAGHAFIAGLLTDNVVVLDQNGGYLMEWDLPDGAIPRALLPHPTSSKALLVYCWGDNTVRAYIVDPSAGSAALRATFRLHHDPTPADIAAGRRVFFDASHSADQNLSCASCHIEGGNDFLMWNLSNGPVEEKGPMFTQTLVGLERLAPFHWRGERQLLDFKPAFTGLLGAAPDDGDGIPEPGEEPSDEQFARFQDFVFAQVNPANPNQNRVRRVDPGIHGPDTTFAGPGEDPPAHDSTLVGEAIDGQQKFQQPALVNVGRHSCVDCHDFPLGTDNDINVEQESAARPRRGSMKPAPFHEVWRKHQSLVRIAKGASVQFRPFLGSGFSHLGTFGDLFRFVSVVTDNLAGTLLDDQQANDITDFIHQWDQGLAPAVHFAYLLDAAASSASIASELTLYLQGEMQKRNCDIAVLGAVQDAGGSLVARRWTWSRGASAYVCEDPLFAARQLQAFIDGAANGESNLFLGLPLGMAERFAVDYDMDGVPNLDPTEIGHEYDAALPGWDDGQIPAFTAAGLPKILWQTTKVARLVFTTSEPTLAVVDYQEPKTAPHQAVSPRLSRHHSLLLTDMRPSTHALDGTDVPEYAAEDVTYSVTITLTDATGNSAPQTPFDVVPEPFIVPDELEQGGPGTAVSAEMRNQRSHVVQAICLGGGSCDQLALVGGEWRAAVDLTLAFKRGAWEVPSGAVDYEPVRAPNRAVIGRVLVERANGMVETATAAGLRVTPVGSSAILADEVQFISPGNQSLLQGVPEPKGQYLAGLVTTDANGKTALVFDVNPLSANGPASDLATGDRILFNVEAAVEVDTAAMPVIDTSGAPGLVIYHTLFRGTFMQWSFPDTKEARSSVRSAPL